MCIEFSEAEMGEAILRARIGEDEATAEDTVLLQLVDQLLSRDIAMWVFAYTVSDIYGPGRVTETIHSAVRSHLAEPLLTREQRRNLHQLCDSLAGLDIPHLFMLSASIGHTLKSNPENIRAVLNELEELPARDTDGLHPIIVFVEYLASEQPPEFRDPLRAWVDDYVGFRTPLLTAVHSIREGERDLREPEPMYCVITMDAEGIDSSRFSLSVHLQEGMRSRVPILPPHDATYTEAEVCGLISGALNHSQLASVHPADLRIEFFLPTCLISLPVDQWPMGTARVALGVKYQVVVRSLTRVQDITSAHAYWRDKGEKLNETEFRDPSGDAGTSGAPEGEWLTEEAATSLHDQIFVRLTKDDGPVYLILAEPPAPAHGQALALALEAGFPVLLWSRRAHVGLRNGIGELLASAAIPCRLSDLPQQVLEFRRDAALRGAEADHLSKHLTLLHDDPQRVPDMGALLRTPA